MNVVFLGTADFGLPTLEALFNSPRHRLVGAVTGPDKPRGRGLASLPTPIGEWLDGVGFRTLFKPERLDDPAFVEALRALPAEVYIVVAFRILPESVFTIPRFAFNLHASLLPKYRGAAPVQRAIAAGETVTGVTTFLLGRKVDTGDILLQKRLEIGPTENTGELLERLAVLGATAVVETLDLLESGQFAPTVQDSSQASPAPKITDHDLPLDFRLDAEALINKARALAPRPGAVVLFRGGPVKMLALRPYSDASLAGSPGRIVAVDKAYGPIVATGNGLVSIGLIQPAGKRPMSGAEFARGYHPEPGEEFSLTLEKSS